MSHSLINTSDIFNFGDIAVSQKVFENNNFVLIKNFLTKVGNDLLLSIYRDLNKRSFRKDLVMAETNFTPRNMNVIGGSLTNENTTLVSLYSDLNLMKNVSAITGDLIHQCPEKIENIIFTNLSEKGDTHGWHLDDFPYALIICLEAPDVGKGGHLEFVDVKKRRRQIYLGEGDAYLMRSDIQKHRVAPLTEKSNRTILNFTYNNKVKSVKTNGTATKLCCPN